MRYSSTRELGCPTRPTAGERSARAQSTLRRFENEFAGEAPSHTPVERLESDRRGRGGADYAKDGSADRAVRDRPNGNRHAASSRSGVRREHRGPRTRPWGAARPRPAQASWGGVDLVLAAVRARSLQPQLPRHPLRVPRRAHLGVEAVGFAELARALRVQRVARGFSSGRAGRASSPGRTATDGSGNSARSIRPEPIAAPSELSVEDMFVKYLKTVVISGKKLPRSEPSRTFWESPPISLSANPSSCVALLPFCTGTGRAPNVIFDATLQREGAVSHALHAQG